MMKLRKRSRAALAAILSCALVFGLSVGALASGVISNNPLDNISTVTLSDSGGALKFTMNRADTDLFANFKGVMPGDTLGQTVRVGTQAGNSSDYHIYLYARVHQAEQETPAVAALSAEEGSNAHGDPSLHNSDFWDQLTLTVTVDGQADPVDLMNAGEGILGVDLGRFAKTGVSKDVQVKLEVPIEMGNEFAEQNAYIDWFFYAQGIDNPGPGPGPNDPDPKPKPDPNPPPVVPPVVDVPDEDVPLNPLDPEPEVDVPDEEVPLDALTPTGDIPQTGDESPMALWATLAVLSGGALVFLVTGLKKKD